MSVDEPAHGGEGYLLSMELRLYLNWEVSKFYRFQEQIYISIGTQNAKLIVHVCIKLSNLGTFIFPFL